PLLQDYQSGAPGTLACVLQTQSACVGDARPVLPIAAWVPGTWKWGHDRPEGVDRAAQSDFGAAAPDSCHHHMRSPAGHSYDARRDTVIGH
ncbi:hypothetical protein P7K49_023219, partial [Saguinus oedipus]